MSWTEATSNSTSGTSGTGYADFATGGTIYIRFGPQYRPPPPVRQVRPAIHPCAVLGVPCEAPLLQVKGAYRRLAKQHHPDLAAGEQCEERTKRMALINHAYDLLVAKHGEGSP